MKTKRRLDLAVVGGGVIGLSVAYEATRRGLRVVVLEREAIGAGAAGVAAGMLAPAAEADTEDEPLVRFAMESCRTYPAFVAAVESDSGRGCGYRSEGTMIVALNRDHEQELERLAAFQSRFGLAVHWLDADHALEREPALTPRVTRALWNAGDRQVNPRCLLHALHGAIEARGGEVLLAAEVDGIETTAGRVSGVRYRHHDIEDFASAAQVVVAGGAWTNELAGRGIESLPLRPVKGQILRLHGPQLIRHVVRSPDVYLVPRDDGELVVGATSEEQGFDRTVTARGVRDLLIEAWRVLPGSEELELRESKASLRPALRDALPCVGASGTQGLFLAVGHYRHGVMLAPATATMLLDLMGSGRLSPLLEPFQFSRLAPRHAQGATKEVQRV